MKKTPSSGKSLISTYSFFCFRDGKGKGGRVGVGAYLSLREKERGWALIRGETIINFFSLWDGSLSEGGTNSRVGAYLNKYGKWFPIHGCSNIRKCYPIDKSLSSG